MFVTENTIMIFKKRFKFYVLSLRIITPVSFLKVKIYVIVIREYFNALHIQKRFPDGLAGKESAYNAGDLGLIPGLGRSPGEGQGCSPQYSGLENSMGSQGVRHN